MAIGPTLQAARLKKKLTTSQVAEQTHMKIQIVEDLEHDDFRRIAATIYGKGFIKLFAECVNLDPTPLIADYMRTLQSDAVPPATVHSPKNSGDDKPRATKAPSPTAEPEQEDLFSFARAQRKHITPAPSRPHATDAFSPPPPSLSETFKQRAHSKKTSFTLAATAFLDAVRKRFGRLTEVLKAYLENLRWSDRLLKILAVTLCVFVMLMLLITVIRYLVNRSPSRPPDNHELILLTPPPEPYVD